MNYIDGQTEKRFPCDSRSDQETGIRKRNRLRGRYRLRRARASRADWLRGVLRDGDGTAGDSRVAGHGGDGDRGRLDGSGRGHRPRLRSRAPLPEVRQGRDAGQGTAAVPRPATCSPGDRQVLLCWPRHVELGIGATWHGMETTSFDGTTAELFSNDVLADAFGVPAGGTKPKVRIVAHVRTGSRRWIGAAIGGYHDGENALVDELASTLRPGMLNLADRGFFSMDRWIRFSATGAHLCWRVKNGARSVPFKMLKTLPDGSELVILHESDGMLSRRRRDTADRTAPRLAGTVARLVQFTVVTRTRSGRTKSSVIRVLTTLLDHAGFPAAAIAALYAERWQVEIAYLHLKKTLRGARRVLRGQSEVLARQEVRAFLLVHNMIATLAARAAALAGVDPDEISFTAVLGLVRAHLQAGTRCPHCGRRPDGPLARLLAGVIAHPGNRADRKRTSGRTPAERRTRHTEEATYTITITPSNLPKWDESLGS